MENGNQTTASFLHLTVLTSEGGWGNSHLKRTGVPVVLLRSLKSGFGTSKGVQPQKGPQREFSR